MAGVASGHRMLGHYRLLEEIGSGGMGVVYRAHDEHLDRDVAVKILPAVASTEPEFDPKARRALRQEALTLSRLNHPSIAQVYDFDREGDTDFVVLELVAGESLAHKLHDGPLAQAVLLSIATQTLDGLIAAHAQGIIHRDLKPANLQITPDGRVKILDFGLARLVRRHCLDAATATTECNTENEGVSGTLPYMSPEQLRGEPCDARSDIWSVGVVLYEMASGRLPFPGKTATAMGDAILHAPVPAISKGTGSLLLRSVIERCLAKDVAQRYQNAQELLLDVQRVASGAGPIPAPTSADVGAGAARTLRSMIVMAAVALLTCGLLVAGFLWLRSKRAAAPTITSVAVLPLANLSGDPAQEYFSDGMTDAIISELSRASSLKVISRTSVMRYKNTNKPVDEIARELHVDGVIEGSALREGDRVRINAQLIYAPAEAQLWADSFERDERNVLALQGEIAHAIMRQLRVRLGEGEEWIQPASVDPEAYDALLKSRFYTYRVTAADNAKAEQFAREAIGRQPDLGEAYHILAEILWYQAMTLGNPTVEESRSLLRDSQAAAEKAISLGANAHSTHALLLFSTTGDAAAAEREYRRGIALQPNLSSVHGHYGVFLATVGRCAEARTELLRAVELDPTGEFAISIAGEFLMYCKDLPSSERYLLAAMDLDPSYQRAHRLAETVYLLQYRVPEMLSLVDSSARSDKEKAEIREAFARGGEAGYRQWVLRRVLSDPTQNQRAFNVAGAYAAFGDRKHALQFLQKACEEGDPRVKWMRAYPQYWFLYGDPEYNDLLRKIGLPETTK
jgi:eukaryotic-like serine/threonine-protein kinase